MRIDCQGKRPSPKPEPNNTANCFMYRIQVRQTKKGTMSTSHVDSGLKPGFDYFGGEGRGMGSEGGGGGSRTSDRKHRSASKNCCGTKEDRELCTKLDYKHGLAPTRTETLRRVRSTTWGCIAIAIAIAIHERQKMAPENVESLPYTEVKVAWRLVGMKRK